MKKKITEASIQAAWIKTLKSIGWIVIRLRAASEAGWPDITAYRNKVTWFIEFKAPGEVPTPLQAARHKALREQGFDVDVIDYLPK